MFVCFFFAFLYETYRNRCLRIYVGETTRRHGACRVLFTYCARRIDSFRCTRRHGTSRVCFGLQGLVPVSGFMSAILDAGTELLACFSRIVLAGSTPFAVHAGTEPHTCVSACRVLSHNDGCSTPLVLRGSVGLRLKPFTHFPQPLNG